MTERAYIKSHEFDLVLNYYWATQRFGDGIASALDWQKKAKLPTAKLAEVLECQADAHISTGDKTLFLENRRQALQDAGGIGAILELHQEALSALAEVGKALEMEDEHMKSAGGIERLLKQHRMFMEAARQFSPIFTIEPGKRSGQPCIRGIRMTITDVLEYQSSGMTDEEILDDFPNLTQEDLDVCRAFGLHMEDKFNKM